MTTKHTIATISVALIAFVFGCVTEALVVPPVRAGTNPQRWEYKYVRESVSVEAAEQMSNRMGAQGWELASADGTIFCFKRPLP